MRRADGHWDSGLKLNLIVIGEKSAPVNIYDTELAQIARHLILVMQPGHRQQWGPLATNKDKQVVT